MSVAKVKRKKRAKSKETNLKIKKSNVDIFDDR